jgi:hypothetical protein
VFGILDQDGYVIRPRAIDKCSRDASVKIDLRDRGGIHRQVLAGTDGCRDW